MSKRVSINLPSLAHDSITSYAKANNLTYSQSAKQLIEIGYASNQPLPQIAILAHINERIATLKSTNPENEHRMQTERRQAMLYELGLLRFYLTGESKEEHIN